MKKALIILFLIMLMTAGFGCANADISNEQGVYIKDRIDFIDTFDTVVVNIK